jgi:hypothetical protein
MTTSGLAGNLEPLLETVKLPAELLLLRCATAASSHRRRDYYLVQSGNG